jgi:hypothetical protein
MDVVILQLKIVNPIQIILIVSVLFVSQTTVLSTIYALKILSLDAKMKLIIFVKNAFLPFSYLILIVKSTIAKIIMSSDVPHAIVDSIYLLIEFVNPWIEDVLDIKEAHAQTACQIIN